jgi:hypothetical protein
MKDFLGNYIDIGDEVVFVQLGYRNLLKGKIVKKTAKTILISHEMTNTCGTETKQYPYQVIKVPKP